MSSLVFDALDLSGITFFGQDWGGLIAGYCLEHDDVPAVTRNVIGRCVGLPT